MLNRLLIKEKVVVKSNHMYMVSDQEDNEDEEDEEEAWGAPPPLVGLDLGSHHGSRCRIAVGVLPWEPPPLGLGPAPYWLTNKMRYLMRDENGEGEMSSSHPA